MKDNQLARNKITSDVIDPLTIVKIQHTALDKSKSADENGDENSESKIKNGESMNMLNLNLREDDTSIDKGFAPSQDLKLPKSHSLIIRDDPRDLEITTNESDLSTPKFDDSSILDQSKFAKPDEIDEEEGKYEIDYDYEVIENDFQKALQERKERKDEIKVYKEMYCLSDVDNPKHPNFIYTDDKNEDEIFGKDVHILDIANTTFIEGKLKLTRYKLVFIPYERIRINIGEEGGKK